MFSSINKSAEANEESVPTSELKAPPSLPSMEPPLSTVRKFELLEYTQAMHDAREAYYLNLGHHEPWDNVDPLKSPLGRGTPAFEPIETGCLKMAPVMMYNPSPCRIGALLGPKCRCHCLKHAEALSPGHEAGKTYFVWSQRGVQSNDHKLPQVCDIYGGQMRSRITSAHSPMKRFSKKITANLARAKSSLPLIKHEPWPKPDAELTMEY